MLRRTKTGQVDLTFFVAFQTRVIAALCCQRDLRNPSVVRRHELMPRSIAIEKLGRQGSVIVANKLDDVLKLCHRTVS